MKNKKHDDYSQRFIELIIKDRDYDLSEVERLELKEKSIKIIEKINWHLEDHKSTPKDKKINVQELKDNKRYTIEELFGEEEFSSLNLEVEESLDSIPTPSVVDSPVATNPFSNLLQKKLKVEETHTRMTFLVRNELAEEFNDLMKKVDRKGKKKEFINTMMEQAIIQLREALSQQLTKRKQ
jgi:hypothetical protein